MKIEVGSKVRVKEAAGGVPCFVVGNVYEVAEIGGDFGDGIGLKIQGATGKNGLWWWHDHRMLELAEDLESARILTKKVMVGNVPCRMILGFEGILGKEELPKKYVEGAPSFWYHMGRTGAHVFDGNKMNWEYPDGSDIGLDMRLPAGVSIDVGCYTFSDMNVGDVWPEKTFQVLLTWLKRAGSRLAKIRKQEKEAWSGQETIEI